MEVHPPEHPIHTWRDFLIHIATIVVGLLIAIGLEQSVEALHRRHLLHQAEAKLNEEAQENGKVLTGDFVEIGKLRAQMLANMALIHSVQTHTAGAYEGQLGWDWNGLSENAWETARSSGALALMPYSVAQTHADLYDQAALVNREADVVFRDLFTWRAPLEGGRKLRELSPAELATMLQRSEQTLADLRYLEMLSRNLEAMYREREAKL